MAGFVVIERSVFINSFFLAERTQVILPPLFLAAERYATLSTNRNSMKIIVTLLLTFLSFSCQREKPKEKITLPKNKSVIAKDNLKLIDTTVILTNIPSSEDCPEITEMEAEKF